jgi:hypothetical protein
VTPRKRRRPGETVAVDPVTRAPLTPRAKAFDPGAAEDSSKRSGPKRVRWIDMVWVVVCEDCPPRWLSGTNAEAIAMAAVDAHTKLSPGHRVTYRNARKGD